MAKASSWQPTIDKCKPCIYVCMKYNKWLMNFATTVDWKVYLHKEKALFLFLELQDSLTIVGLCAQPWVQLRTIRACAFGCMLHHCTHVLSIDQSESRSVSQSLGPLWGSLRLDLPHKLHNTCQCFATFSIIADQIQFERVKLRIYFEQVAATSGMAEAPTPKK